jgi:hypothetical protein
MAKYHLSARFMLVLALFMSVASMGTALAVLRACPRAEGVGALPIGGRVAGAARSTGASAPASALVTDSG